MAVYKRSYKAYAGPLTPAWSRFLVLSRYGLSKMFESRPFTAFTMACMIPFLGALVFIYVVHNTAVQAVLNVRIGPNALVDNLFFFRFMAIEAWMAFLVTAWFGPGMISKDFANHGIQLYLSRPLSRAEYLFGKVSVLGILLSCTTWIPALLLFFINAEMVGRNWAWENRSVAGAILVSGLLWVALISLLAMALSVWVRWRIAATGLIFAVFFLLPGFGEAMNAILRTQWGKLLNLGYLVTTIWGHLFLTKPQLRFTGFNLIPLWSAWAMLLAVCAFSVWILNARLRAREVERG